MQDLSSANPSTSSSANAKRIPTWAAGAGAAVFLVVAGFFIYWFLRGSFAGSTDLIPDPNRAQQSGRGNWRQQANADGVQPLPGNRGWLVRAGSAYMEVENPQDNKKRNEPNFHFRYDSQALLAPEQWHLALGLRRIGQDTQMAKTLDVTPDQFERLRRLTGLPMELSKADRDQLAAAWADYSKAAAKGDPEKKLVAALKAVGSKSLPATKARAGERIAEISRILTPDQVRELTKLGAGQPVTPITPRIQVIPTTRHATTRPA